MHLSGRAGLTVLPGEAVAYFLGEKRDGKDTALGTGCISSDEPFCVSYLRATSRHPVFSVKEAPRGVEMLPWPLREPQTPQRALACPRGGAAGAHRCHTDTLLPSLPREFAQT